MTSSCKCPIVAKLCRRVFLLTSNKRRTLLIGSGVCWTAAFNRKKRVFYLSKNVCICVSLGGEGLGIKNPLFPIRVLCKFHVQNNKEFSIVDVHLYISISINFLEVLGTTSRAKNRYYFYFRSLDPEKEKCDIYERST